MLNIHFYFEMFSQKSTKNKFANIRVLHFSTRGNCLKTAIIAGLEKILFIYKKMSYLISFELPWQTYIQAGKSPKKQAKKQGSKKVRNLNKLFYEVSF